MLRREESEIETKYGQIRMKQSFFNGKMVRSKPEFEDCKILAEKHKLSISEIEKEVNEKNRKKMSPKDILEKYKNGEIDLTEALEHFPDRGY